MSLSSLKLHNAMWPGLVGKGDGEGEEPPISLGSMLELTANAEVDGRKFDGIDYFLFLPHTDPNASDDEFKQTADLIASKALILVLWLLRFGRVRLETLLWVRMSSRVNFGSVQLACRVAKIFNEHGARKGGVIRIDSAEFGVEKWKANPGGRNSPYN